MARRLTAEDLMKLGESGQSGGTLGEQEARKRRMQEEKDADDKKKRKGKRGYFEGRRDKRTILSTIKSMAGMGEDDE